MNNIIRRHTKPAYNRCASTGYRPAKMPFGYDQADPRCIEFMARLKGTIEALIDEGYRCRSRHRSAIYGELPSVLLPIHAILQRETTRSPPAMTHQFPERGIRWIKACVPRRKLRCHAEK